MAERTEGEKRTTPVPGVAVIGLFFLAGLSIVGAFAAMFHDNFVGAGVCLLPAAIGLGVILHVYAR